MARLSEDDLDHRVTVPPGRWFVRAPSNVDAPPVTTVRGGDGTAVIELEREPTSGPSSRPAGRRPSASTPSRRSLPKPGESVSRWYPSIDPLAGDISHVDGPD